MHGMPRQLFKSLTLALLLTFAVAAHASATSVTVKPVPEAQTAALAGGPKPPASVKLRVCRGGAYYDNRLIAFRVRMGRTSTASGAQNLMMRFEVLQRLHENTRFKKLKADGLGEWFSSSDSATLYQRDLALTNIETAATYRAKVSFRWTAADGSIEARRVIVSSDCKQKIALPKLKITNDTAVPIVGSTALSHTVTIANDGKSEVMNLPVAIYIDSLTPVVKVIDSIGPNQAADIQLNAAACQIGGAAVIDPFRSLVRIPQHTRTPFALPRCR
ncbi:MAG: hypothetical protein JHC98_11330 [Thermoleophilaceae bacterium]|nr:hypothetical protein [Thermoleophilaceae bacterium]